MALSDFDRPIPGQALTDEPRNYPWERPSQTSNPEDALRFYVKKLEDPDMMDKVMQVLEDTSMSLTGVVKGLTRAGVAGGRHSIDVGLIVGPAIHEYIKGVADVVGVNYEEGLPKKGTDEAEERKKATLNALELLKDSDISIPTDSDIDTASSKDEPEEEIEIEDTMAEEEPAGLMARRSV